MRVPNPSKKLIQPGVYEILSVSTNLFVDALDGQVYNGWYDDALTMSKLPSRRAKWEIAQIGGGYTIKQVSSGLYCAVADGEQFLHQPVVLSAIPTVWNIDSKDVSSADVQISWSVSDLYWSVFNTKEAYTIGIDKQGENSPMVAWRLNPVGEASIGGKLKPGVYSLQNKEGGTFVMLAKDEKTLACSPSSDFASGKTKLWELMPFGDGYTIRLHGTDRYCTMVDSIADGTRISLSNTPAAWRIVPVQSPVHGSEAYFLIYWSGSNKTWDLHNGSSSSQNPIHVHPNNSHKGCRLWKFVS